MYFIDWEQCYRDGETPWDLAGAAPPLSELLEERPAEIWGEGPVLVPGCGLGHDAVLLHEYGHEVLALDLAPSALSAARICYGTPRGLAWMEGDFFDERLAAAHPVSALFEHTCFCAIDPALRRSYVEAARRWLRPGGRLVGVFYLDPPPREDGKAGPPFRSEAEEIRDLFTPYFEILREGVPGRSHPERAGREMVVEMVGKH